MPDQKSPAANTAPAQYPATSNNIECFPERRCGWTGDTDGFSRSFSWWRNHLKPGVWSVIAHENIGTFMAGCMYAITDDFGNLVHVPA